MDTVLEESSGDVAHEGSTMPLQVYHMSWVFLSYSLLINVA